MLNNNIKHHYTRSGLESLILEALANAGKDVNNLKPEDLAPIDEFHSRGREATIELARAAGIDSSKHVLDIGCGIGGPSRYIASEFGCLVIGLDLTDEYCRAAKMLAKLVGLTHLVSYLQGDALNLPFPDATFDIVWTQHVAMNIPDKSTLYREMNRVLKPGGLLAIYDILAGPTGPVLFPVPWSRIAETSFLVTPAELRKLLEGTGFTIESWHDKTDALRKLFTNRVKKIHPSGQPPLGLQVLLGPDFRVMAQNLRLNIEEGHIVLAQVVGKKTDK